MRILHIGKYYPPFHGGIENFMADLMLEQSQIGHKVQALVHNHQADNTFVSEELPEGIVHRIPTKGTAVFVPIAPGFGKHLSAVVDSFRPDIIHMHMPNVSCFWALFSKEVCSIPWVIHWHADVVGEKPDWRIKALYPFYRIFEKAILKRAKKVITTSAPYFETSKPLMAYRSKCEVVQLGIKDVSYLGNQRNNALSPLKLLCIGRLTYYKGHEVLLNAMGQLNEKNERVFLDIVGSGELEDYLKGLTSKLKLNDRIVFSGSVSMDVLTKKLQECDLLCLPSIERTEAFGVVLLESMRAGKPCLVTDVPGSGMSWVVEKDKTGIVVESGSDHSLANALFELVNDRPRIEVMGLNARKRFESLFTIEAVNKKIDKIYREILGLS